MDRISIPQMDLVFDQSKSKISFEDFVRGVSNLHESERIRRFILRLTSVEQSQHSKINKCLQHVLKRSVKFLVVDIKVPICCDYMLPSEVFTSTTVVTMSLGSGFVLDNQIFPEDASLPCLKTLILDSVLFNEDGVCVFQRLLSACPELEELVIFGFNLERWKWSGTVSSQTLKKLTLWRKGRYQDGDISHGTIGFDTPSLEYLEIYDVPRDGYIGVNFKSLVEAKLQFVEFLRGETYDLTDLIKGLKNVQILSLDDDYTVSLFEASSEEFPKFENLLQLTVATKPDICWNSLESLLKKSPNIKTLTIEGTLHYTKEPVCECLKDYSFLSSCLVETVKITKFKADIGEMVQIEHVLMKLTNLELLEVNVEEKKKKEKVKIMADFLMFRRASTKCKVRVEFPKSDI